MTAIDHKKKRIVNLIDGARAEYLAAKRAFSILDLAAPSRPSARDQSKTLGVGGVTDKFGQSRTSKRQR